MKNLRSNKSYKDYVKEAKSRMMSNNYSDATRMGVAIGSKSYFINSRNVTGEELYSYYKKVVQVVDDGQQAIGIGALVDEMLYARLNPSEKERYVLELSKLYRDMKEEYCQKKVK